MRLSTIPLRLATGAFVAHSGWEKWSGGEETAAGIHGMASGAYPPFKNMKPGDFLKMLSVGEMATGAALLAPFVSARVAGAMLTGFAGGLMGLYFRTEGMRKPGSVWPTQQGLGISKDVWMLAIGVSLLAEEAQRKS